MHDLLAKRTVSERMFTRHCGIIESLLSDESSSVRIIERNLNELTIRWNAIQEAHDLYIISCFTSDSDVATQDSFIMSYTEKFITIQTACDKFISTQSSRSVPPVKQFNSIKLERLKFRTFDGDIRRYPKFKSEFIKFVEPLCSESQLTFVLKSYLCDSVRREVDNIDHDIAAMWKRLDEKYGMVHKLIDCIMYDVKNLPKCSDNSSTLQMIRLVETAHADLTCINAVQELQNSTILSLIEQCMPPLMLEEWVRLVVADTNSSQAKFDKLLPFLQHWKLMIEYQDADIRKLSAPSYVSNCCTPTPAPIRKCLVHQDADHPVWRCRVFRNMPLKERQNIIRSNNACSLCLEVGHLSTDCRKTFRCTISGCNSAHNVLLHDGGTDAR